jgi:hypothetical protein
MPGYSVTAANQALDALSGGTTNVLAFVSLHTADPGTTGASEATGGGYARQSCSWNSAASRAKTNSTALTFTTTGSTANSHFGTSSAVSAGTFGISGALTSSVTAVTITVASGALSLGA